MSLRSWGKKPLLAGDDRPSSDPRRTPWKFSWLRNQRNFFSFKLLLGIRTTTDFQHVPFGCSPYERALSTKYALHFLPWYLGYDPSSSYLDLVNCVSSDLTTNGYYQGYWIPETEILLRLVRILDSKRLLRRVIGQEYDLLKVSL